MSPSFSILFPLGSPTQLGMCSFLKENAEVKLLEAPSLENTTSALAVFSQPASIVCAYVISFSSQKLLDGRVN